MNLKSLDLHARFCNFAVISVERTNETDWNETEILSNHTDNRFLVSFWNYNFSKKDKLENIQCLKFDEYYQMIDKENLLIMDDDNSIIQLNFKKIKGKAKNIVETTTVSEFNKKRKKKKIK